MEGFQEASTRRFEHIGSRIDETLKEDEAGALFISEDHRVQFPPDVQVFYVAPPALDALKRWIGDMQTAARSAQQAAESGEAPEEEETAEPEPSEAQPGQAPEES